VSHGLEWSRARRFLRGRYGAGAIKQMYRPIVVGGTWLAVVYQEGKKTRVEFQRTGTRNWTILKEMSKGEVEDEHHT